MKNKVMEKLMLKASGSLNKFSAGIVKGRWICFGVFIALTIACVCLIPQIKVEYDLTTQMPQDSYTSEALDVLKREFDDKGMAYVCVVNIDSTEAKDIANELKEIDGVANVTYVEQMNFKNGKALYTVNLKDYDSTAECFDTIERIIDHLDNTSRESYLTGQSAYSYFTKAETEESILKIGVVIVALILVMLIFTSKTYFEILLMLMVFAVAVAINMGTNVLFDGISYISNLVSLVLQLALSLDYMVVLLHRYMEERQSYDAKEATARALSKGIVEICSSALTTIAGLGSLLLMTMPIGVEIGLSLGKSIVASLLTVIFFMPALLVLLDKPLMKSKHRSFVPSIKRPAKAILKARWVIVPLFVVIVVLSCVGQLQNVYGFNYNGGSMILDAK
ncbi:MAG: MMPL family transporter, partial [Clostridia bacterium]|nr:MMPL family transporter [Clostridia bacterium]